MRQGAVSGAAAATAVLLALFLGAALGYVTASRLPGVTVTSTTTLETPVSGARVERVCFSPGGRCSLELLRLFRQANRSIHVMIYSFTLDSLANSLIDATRRGVEVRVIIEKDNAFARGSEYEKLKAARVNIRLDGNSADMHNKVAVIDGYILVTGSFNWSTRAEEDNNENLIVIVDRRVAKIYEDEFERIWRQAT